MEYALIPLIVFCALFIKGIAGTGTTTTIVAFTTLLIDPKATIVLAAFINIFGGLAMLRIDPMPLAIKYWIPIAAFMGLGSILGAYALKIIDPQIFELILGIAFIFAALRFLTAKPKTDDGDGEAGKKASPPDLGVGFFAGFCGGFIGINAPVLVSHFGRFLNKQHLRRLLVLIFIPSAFVQTGTYYLNDMLTREIITYGLISLPALAAGIYAGNLAHQKISDLWFKRILGALLLVVSLKLIF